MGIILIIGGIVRLIIGLIGILGGGAIVYGGALAGSGLLIGVGAALMVVSALGGVLELLMGIYGVRGTHLSFCLTMAIIVLGLDVAQLVMSHGQHLTEPIISLCISGLYLIGCTIALHRR